MEDKPYKCGLCGEEYRTKKLKSLCEKTPVAKSKLPLGSVFKFSNDLFGILYTEDHVQRQTHITLYKAATTGLCLTDDKIWSVMPEVKFEAPFLNNSSPVTDEEFEKVKKALEHALRQNKDSTREHTLKLRELKLIPYKI